MADCLIAGIPQETALQAFGKKATIGNILPIFNPGIVNFELFHCLSTLSKLKSIDLDNFLNGKMVQMCISLDFLPLKKA